ncbi:MtrB/PioB family decaheme-associated outer membrane protein [Sinimarinibacterium sp. CAU 1509]|uniref:MtrB/PioB family decaheme-associated outer membrane protein n=1 Tax=Sinimarinibacterium sp. CAU 1509 TaxID=2562283 RepID=UPI0010AD8590|nr:MtrB/PioB family decaheme-associated outer membrane protein [Sinimarinibacterium sp. CAU 1509]TJY58928.1 MtrB/PioB family decaheme-associated outer membrane protein [Sinimarinibacterium sp. CAU 1509]
MIRHPDTFSLRCIRTARTVLRVITASATLFAGTAAADTPEEATPLVPPCKQCPFEQGFSGQLDLGLGYLFDDAYHFGDYTGLSDQGLFLLGGASIGWREADGTGYWDLEARDLGLDARAVELRGGQQGLFGIRLSYDSVPRRINDTASTPFLGVGSDTLSLPVTWTSATSTQQMPDLASSLQPLTLAQDRKRFLAAFNLIPSAHWTTQLSVRHDERDGIKPVGGSFITLASLLPQPTSDQTDQVDLSAGVTGTNWQAGAAYYGSFYRNDNTALTWQNPYDPLVDDGVSGRLALAPDNQFHQLSVTAGYQPEARVRLSTHVAVGRMLQNARFVPASATPSLMTPLPRTALDGQIDTLSGRLRASAGPWAGLRFNAEAALDDRDNRTPQSAYTQIITDVFAADERANQPYDFTRRTLKLGSDYRLQRWARLSAGWDQERKTRSFQARHRTDEWKLWTRMRVQPAQRLSTNIGYVHASRTGSTYRITATDAVSEQQLQQAHLADRVRDAATLNISTTPLDWISVDVNGSLGRDHYPDTTVGLQRRRAQGYGVDLSLHPSELFGVTGFWSRDALETLQDGNQSAADFADWRADNRDAATVAGLRAERRKLWGRYDAGASYEYTSSRGDTRLLTGSANTPFPDLRTRRHEARMYALFQATPQLGIRVEYRYALYHQADWALDGVSADAVHNLLSLDASSPSYTANLIGISTRYEFR